MLQKIKKPTTKVLLAVPVVVLVLSFLLSPAVFAASCGNTTTNVIECGNDNAIWDILLIVINILTAGIGLVAVGGIVYGAILYATAQNNSTQITKAKTTIANTMFGLVGFALMYSFLQYIIPGGFINSLANPPSIPQPSVSTNPPNGNNGGNNNNDGNNNNSDNVTAADIRIKNFRDASAVTNGNVLKSGVLYRSAQLSGVSDNQRQKLSQLLGNKAIIIDLRTSNDPPDQTINGVSRIAIPTTGFHETGPAVTNPSIRRSISKAMKTAANANGPVLFHCVAGKDRTGWTVAMIMFIVGANEAQMKKEYAESTKAFPDHDPKWINVGLTLAKRNYGTIMQYIRGPNGLGLSEAEIRKIRQKFGA